MLIFGCTLLPLSGVLKFKLVLLSLAVLAAILFLLIVLINLSAIIMEYSFLAKINSRSVKEKICRQTERISSLQFRFPSEAEWEYAANGGIHWTARFSFVWPG